MMITRCGMFTLFLILASNGLQTMNANIVTNGSFEIPGPVDPTIFNGQGPGGASAAADWTVYNNTNGSTETEQMLYPEALLPPIYVNNPGFGGDHVIRVEASHHGNGIVQVFGPLGTGPPTGVAEAWVYVNSGVMGAGIGNGGSTQMTAFSSTTGQWEKLSFTESTSPVNEIIFYAVDGSSEFYVDLVYVSVPEPGTAGFCGFLAGAAVLARRRFRRS